MTIITTGMNGPSYQFTATPTTFGPWHQVVHGDTSPHHVHFGQSMYYLNYPTLYTQVRPPQYHPFPFRRK
jgi:hypothetical protein